MGFEIPDWLTKDFIKTALEDGAVGTVTVESIEVDKPIPKGDNYLCDIYRVKTVFKKANNTSETSLIVKSPLTSGMNGFFEKIGLIEKEVRFYNEYVPKVDELLGGVKLHAKSYHSSQKNVLVLEDLKFAGYCMADKRAQLDYDHCVVALTSLAKFHAASVKAHENDPAFVEDVGEEAIFAEKNKQYNEWFASTNFQLMVETCKRIPELNRYTEQLIGYGENAWDILTSLMTPKENELNVMNHGDFWVNNMLFRYENNKPVDLKLIDLQISRYTYPSIDLYYFLYSSVQEDVRVKRKDELLNIYLKELNSNLEKLGTTQRLKESDFKEMLNGSEFFALLISISLFPLIISDPKDGVMDMNNVTENSFKNLDTHPMRHYYQGKTFLEVIPKRLKEFEKSGWF